MKKLITLIFLFSIAISALASTASLNKALQKLINHNSNPRIQNTEIGVAVESIRHHNMVYRFHAKQLFTPASVQKLLTAAAAVLYLKPNFIFKTSILTTGKVQNAILNGDLYIKFTGDPELRSQQLDALFARLHEKGIDKINGHVFIDNTAYNWVPYAPGWLWDDLSYSYAAPMNAIIINRNKFLLHFIPAKTPGQKPRLKYDLPRGVIRIINHVKTTQKYYQNCPLTIYSNAENVYRVGGCLNGKAGTQRRSLALRNVVSYTKALIRQLLKRDDIRYRGAIRIAHTPKTATLLVQHTSPPLHTILIEMLKKSDNLTTDALTKKLGEKYFKTTGTWQNGLMAIKKILGPETGINFKQNLITDGAGLSRYNLLTPMQVIKLLNLIAHRRVLRHVIIPALPIAGVDGTLEYSMKNLAQDHRVRLKTGSMAGVTNLAGFIQSKHHGKLAVVIFINHFVKPKVPYKLLQRNICTLLVNSR